MNDGKKHSSSGYKAIHCDCGTTIEVSYLEVLSHKNKESFNCPLCGKEHAVMASSPITAGNIKIAG